MQLINVSGNNVEIVESVEHEFEMNTKNVAIGYGTSADNIRNAKRNNPEEFIENKHYLIKFNKRNQKVMYWTKKGIVRLGFFIKSKKAKEFRDWAEDYIVNERATPTQLDMITPYEVRRDLATTRRLLTIEKRKHRETAEYYEKKFKALTAKEPFTVTEVPNTQHTDIAELQKNFKIILQEHFELENANAKLRRDNANLQRALISFSDRYHSIVLEADNKVEAIRGELENMTNRFQLLPNLKNDGKNLNTDTKAGHSYW